MKHIGDFDYYRDTGEENSYFLGSLSINRMEVDGGANRIINFSSTDDVNIASELEQARTFKNISLYLTSADTRGMNKAIDLMSISANKYEFRMGISLYTYSGKHMIGGFNLVEKKATFKFPPRNAAGGTLLIALTLPDSELTRTVQQRNSAVTSKF